MYCWHILCPPHTVQVWGTVCSCSGAAKCLLSDKRTTPHFLFIIIAHWELVWGIANIKEMGFLKEVSDGCGCLFVLNLGLVGLGLCGTDMWAGGVIILIIVVVYYLIISSSGRDDSTSKPSTPTRSTATTSSFESSTNKESPKPQTTIIQPISSQIKRPAHPQVTVCKSPTLSNDWLATRLAITKNLSPVKKINHDSFRQELLRHGISCFYHFTDERNLQNIRKYGGLISWYSCAKHEIGVISAGGDSLSRNLDVRYGLQDYVRLSFCRDHPMAYKHKLAGKNLVLLQIKIDVALWEETLFSNMNATDNEHSHGGSLNDLKQIDFAAVKKNYVRRDDEDFKYHQAEILVKTAIPKEFIVNLDNPIYL